jgi:hypothetical protein
MLTTNDSCGLMDTIRYPISCDYNREENKGLLSTDIITFVDHKNMPQVKKGQRNILPSLNIKLRSRI